MNDAPRRTVPIKLNVPRERRGDLHQTTIPALRQPNFRVGVAIRRLLHHQQVESRRRPYDELREETDLIANLVQKGIRRAIEAVQGGVEKLKQGENTSQPEFDSWSVVYDKRSATFNADHATLSTPNGRVTAEYVLPPEDEREDTPFGRYYESEEWDASSASLQYDEHDDLFYLHVTLKNSETRSPDRSSGPVGAGSSATPHSPASRGCRRSRATRGLERRRDVLATELGWTMSDVESVESHHLDEQSTHARRLRAGNRDDPLDAFVLAVTARDETVSLPEDPPTDRDGLPMEVVAPASVSHLG